MSLRYHDSKNDSKDCNEKESKKKEDVAELLVSHSIGRSPDFDLLRGNPMYLAHVALITRPKRHQQGPEHPRTLKLPMMPL